MLKAFDGGRLFGASFGSDTPWVLALPGWARSHEDFVGVLGPQPATSVVSGAPHGRGDAGARDVSPLDAVALDPPGFGATPAPPAPWGSPQYAAAVAPVLSELRDPAVVVGHSFGGRVAVHLAVARPDRVKAVVLTGVPLLRRSDAAQRPPLGYRLGRALHRRGLLGEARMEALRQRHGSPDYRAARGVMRDVLVKVVNETYEAPLRALRCPVELVWGDDDSEAPLWVAEAVAEMLARPTITVCPGAGHLLPLTAPHALRAAIERHRP